MADYNYTIYNESSALDSVLVPKNSTFEMHTLSTGNTAISNFTVTPRHLALALTWTNPTDIDLSAIRINYSTTEVPATIEDGTFLYADSGTSTSLSALSANEYYYFRAWSIDTESNTSTVSGFGVPFFNPWYPGTLPGETPTQTRNRYCEEAII